MASITKHNAIPKPIPCHDISPCTPVHTPATAKHPIAAMVNTPHLPLFPHNKQSIPHIPDAIPHHSIPGVKNGSFDFPSV